MVKKEKKIEEEKYKSMNLRFSGSKNDVIEFDEIKDLVNYMQGKGWKLTFKKLDWNENPDGSSKNTGWLVEFRK